VTVIGIRPRYEYRAWGPDLGDVRRALESVSECLETRECVETYLVARGDVPANPKVRRGALEVKALVEVREGFELWHPEIRSLLPVPADVVAEVLFDRLEAPPFDLERDSYTLPQLRQEIEARCDEVAVVEVSKSRRAYAMDHCLAEFAEVTIGGTDLQTAALESPEVAPLQRAARMLDLDGYANASYFTAVKSVIGW
jgi:hypothetical protein